MPKSNEFFWEQKTRRKKARYIATEFVLQTEGWSVIRVWECEIKKVKDREKILETLYKQIITPHNPYQTEESTLSVAAETSEAYGNDI